MPESSQKRYKIGEVASITGMPISRLRYYDKMGILSPRWRDNNSEYRLYDGSQLEEAYLIEEYQYFGFQLKQIRKLLGNPSAFYDNVIQITNERLDELDSEIARMQKLQRKLRIMRDTEAMKKAEFTSNDYLLQPLTEHSFILSDELLDISHPSHYETAIQLRCSMHNADRKLPWYVGDEFYRFYLNWDRKKPVGRFCIRFSTDETLSTPMHLYRETAPYCIKYMGQFSAQSVSSHVDTMLAVASSKHFSPCGQFFYVGEMVAGNADKAEQAIRQIVIPLKKDPP